MKWCTHILGLLQPQGSLGLLPPQGSLVCVQGTHVVSGDGLCVVLRTGNGTYIAGIAEALAAQGHMNAFDYAVRRIVYVFITFVVVMVPLVIVLNGLTTGNYLAAIWSCTVAMKRSSILCIFTYLCVDIHCIHAAPSLSLCQEVAFSGL